MISVSARQRGAALLQLNWLTSYDLRPVALLQSFVNEAIDTEQVRQMRWLAKMELGEVDVIDGPL